MKEADRRRILPTKKEIAESNRIHLILGEVLKARATVGPHAPKASNGDREDVVRTAAACLNWIEAHDKENGR